jgi:hypothetical protein
VFYDLTNKWDLLSQIYSYNLRWVVVLVMENKIAFVNNNSVLVFPASGGIGYLTNKALGNCKASVALRRYK